MEWVELSVDSSNEFVEPLSEIFYRYGTGGVVVEAKSDYLPDEGEIYEEPDLVTIKTYLPLGATTNDDINHIDVGVRLSGQLGWVSSLRKRILDQDSWESAWKEHFHVLKIGEKIVIVPTWREYQAQDFEATVLLDPGMAFGTGHHPTTHMCLELLEDLLSPGNNVLDVGCGSGILSIASAKLGARSVYSLDIDALALKAAASNVSANNVQKIVTVINGSLPNNKVNPSSYDVVVSNISAKVVFEMVGELVASLKPGGYLIISGILTKDKSELTELLASKGVKISKIRDKGDWLAVSASKNTTANKRK